MITQQRFYVFHGRYKRPTHKWVIRKDKKKGVTQKRTKEEKQPSSKSS